MPYFFKNAKDIANPLLQHRPFRWAHSHARLSDINVIYLIGGPSSGKSTIATLLASRYQLVHILPDEAIRQLHAGGPELINVDSQNGEVQDKAFCLLLRRAINRHVDTGKQGFIIEGFPTNAAQLEYFSRFFQYELAIGVQASEDTMEKRRMATPMTFAEGDKRLKEFRAQKESFYANEMVLVQNKTFNAKLVWVKGEKSEDEIMAHLIPHVNRMLKIEETEENAPGG